jgi:hypothetical protein
MAGDPDSTKSGPCPPGHGPPSAAPIEPTWWPKSNSYEGLEFLGRLVDRIGARFILGWIGNEAWLEECFLLPELAKATMQHRERADNLLSVHRRDLWRGGYAGFTHMQDNAEHWLIAQQETEREFREAYPASSQRLHVVRAEIIRRSRAGDLQLMICHHLGGPPEKFQPEWWYRPNPESLFYRCSIDPDDPFGRRPNRMTDNVHLIYASCDRVDLIVVAPLPAPLEAEPQSPRTGSADAAAPETAGSPPEPEALADLIRRELAAMSPEYFVGGCLLQDLIGHLFTAVRPDKGGAPLLGGELLKSVFEALTRAARAGHYTLTGHRNDPSVPMQTIPPATLPSFRFNEWDRSRLIVDGSGAIWHGVTVWRIEVEAPDTEAGEDLDEPKDRGGSPGVWDWEGLIPVLKETKRKKQPFKDDDAFEDFCRINVQRRDSEAERGDDPELRTVKAAIKKYRLADYVIIQLPDADVQ